MFGEKMLCNRWNTIKTSQDFIFIRGADIRMSVVFPNRTEFIDEQCSVIENVYFEIFRRSDILTNHFDGAIVADCPYIFIAGYSVNVSSLRYDFRFGSAEYWKN